MKWISTKERLPDENGLYLCCIMARGFRYMTTCDFALNLEDVDEYDFPGEKHSGWYKYDSEHGYFEVCDVAYWMPLPDMPKEMTEGKR
jgi:hypothetical protein